MPGLLKPSAACPQCIQPLVAIVDTSNSERVIREYFHAKPIRGRRSPPCKQTFTDLDAAAIERKRLEIRPRRINWTMTVAQLHQRLEALISKGHGEKDIVALSADYHPSRLEITQVATDPDDGTVEIDTTD